MPIFLDPTTTPASALPAQSMTLDEATQAVMDRGFDYLSAARVHMMLNSAKDEFEDVYEWPWLQRAVTGVTPLTLADLKLVLSVRQGNNELLGLTLRQAAQGFTDLAQGGTADYWWLEGDDILHLYPGDGGTASIVYVRDSPQLVAGIDTPLIPARYQSMWIDYAVVEAYKDSDNYSGAQALRADIALRMQNVITRYETRNRQHSPFMSVRDFHGDE
jgi:hypothetical protein